MNVVPATLGGLGWLALAGSGCASGSPPTIGQAVVHVDTDAPVRAEPGTKEHGFLVDRLRIDVYEDGRPTDASREFAVDASTFRDGRASFGVVAPEGASISVRVRLYRLDRSRGGDPAPSTTLDTTASIPAPGEGTTAHVAVLLSLADVGTLVGYPEPVIAPPWTTAPSKVGTAYAARGCARSPEPGEACVPGGVFMLGDAPEAYDSVGIVPDERVVAVAPFFLDLREVTTDQFAAVFPDWRTPLPDLACVSWGARKPLNCVGRDLARAYCQRVGKDLPTEAQYEWIASGMGRERIYPWGNDPPQCVDASGAVVIDGQARSCREQPALGGLGVRDRVALDGGEVVDLAANLRELMRDDLGPQLHAGTLLVDPIGEGSGPITRGGAFDTRPQGMRATSRSGIGVDGAPNAGFRCARAAE